MKQTSSVARTRLPVLQELSARLGVADHAGLIVEPHTQLLRVVERRLRGQALGKGRKQNQQAPGTAPHSSVPPDRILLRKATL